MKAFLQILTRLASTLDLTQSITQNKEEEILLNAFTHAASRNFHLLVQAFKQKRGQKPVVLSKMRCIF